MHACLNCYTLFSAIKCLTDDESFENDPCLFVYAFRTCV